MVSPFCTRLRRKSAPARTTFWYTASAGVPGGSADYHRLAQVGKGRHKRRFQVGGERCGLPDDNLDDPFRPCFLQKPGDGGPRDVQFDGDRFLGGAPFIVHVGDTAKQEHSIVLDSHAAPPGEQMFISCTNVMVPVLCTEPYSCWQRKKAERFLAPEAAVASAIMTMMVASLRLPLETAVPF